MLEQILPIVNATKEDAKFAFDAELAPKELQVRRTKNYSQFKTIKGNRRVAMGHVNNLIKMMAQYNLLPQFVGVATRDGFLVDGQHRLKAAEANDEWFYFTTIPQKVDDIIVTLVNSVQLKWTVDDYVNFFADRGNEQYAWLRERHLETKISNSSLLALFRTRMRITDLRAGTMVLFTTKEEEQYLFALLDGYFAVKKYLDRNVWTDQDFVIAIRKMYQQINSEELIEAIQRWGKVIPQQDHDKDYLRLFEDIINKGKHKEGKNQVRFF